MEEQDVLVKVEALSKKFCKNLKTSLWYGIKDLIYGVRGNTQERELRHKEFWAVKDVSFELRRGECLGLIGHNGAGKSTLLKIINGLINPDGGSVTIKGRVGALIELGAGFNYVLTGRENIYNNGAILGFSRQEIDSKLDAIIDFAELEAFIDMPVQNYSSGMKVRLGFAIAAQMEPDVLLIDEVLAVGDLGFILKCFKTIDTILPQTAIIFVSHSMPMVSRICNQIILMEHGKAQFQGSDVGKAIDLYYNRFSENARNVVFDDGTIELEKVEICNPVGFEAGIPYLNWSDDLEINFWFKVKKAIKVPSFHLIIFDKEQRPCAILKPNSKDSGLEIINGSLNIKALHSEIQLSKGLYTISMNVYKTKRSEPLLRINNLLVFQIFADRDVMPPFDLKSKFYPLKI